MNAKILEAFKEAVYFDEEMDNPITSETKLSEFLLEAVDMVELLIDLETDLEVLIDDKEAYTWKTFGDLEKTVTRLMTEKAKGA